MNKKAWYTFRIVLGGYLAWLGIRMLIEMVNEKPNNMVFMCVMSVIFILIGLAYAIYYVKKKCFGSEKKKIIGLKRKIKRHSMREKIRRIEKEEKMFCRKLVRMRK